MTPKPVGDDTAQRVRPGVRRSSVAWFLGALSVLFITAPFLENIEAGKILESVFFTIALSCGVLAVGGRRPVLIIALALVIPTLATKWLHHFGSSDAPFQEAFYIGGMLFTGYVATHLLLFVLRARRVNSEVLCAGIAIYLLLSLLCAFLYSLIAATDPHAFAFTAGPISSERFEGFNVLYFSLVSLNTAAFGDIVPVSGAARMVAMTETTIGVFYIAVLVARLVSLYAPGAQSSESTRP